MGFLRVFSFGLLRSKTPNTVRESHELLELEHSF